MRHRFWRFLGWLWLKACFRLSAEGAENIPADGGLLVVSNHASFVDPIAVGCSSKRLLTYLARASLRGSRVYRFLTAGIPIVPIDRDGFDREALRRVAAAVEGGGACLLFPEGTRSPDGRLGELKAGAHLLARQTSAPVVPAFIEGSHLAWPRGRSWPRLRGRIRVRFGAPLELAHLPREEAQRALRDALVALAPESQRPAAPGAADVVGSARRTPAG